MQQDPKYNAYAYQRSKEQHNNEAVILLHGLARTKASFRRLAKVLTLQGYSVVNLSYPSTKASIETLAQDIIKQSLQQCPATAKVHFVTHSMGGILLRQYLANNTIEKLGNVVMLGPPNQGSQIVDKLKSIPLFGWINGPAGMQLGTDSKAIVNSLPDANFSLGIIAGNRSINLLLSTLLPTANDGKVTVASTKLPGMQDHLVLPVTHPFMMNNKQVIQKILHFLKFSCFYK
ncbi:MAG: hypothetical protein OFPI_32130 [Osedax symbiont Rs2]|nr:MAG: hypothetical protein OFPI_32130 [Osedax symbiont Rs2]